MKYEIGDTVVIRNDLKCGGSYRGMLYVLMEGESCIKGKEVVLTGYRKGDSGVFECSEYSGISHEMIDHEKTLQIKSNPNYEVY